MELRPYEYCDPGRLLTQVMAERALVEHELVLVLIRAPSVDQQIVRTVRFTETPPPQGGSLGALRLPQADRGAARGAGVQDRGTAQPFGDDSYGATRAGGVRAIRILMACGLAIQQPSRSCFRRRPLADNGIRLGRLHERACRTTSGAHLTASVAGSTAGTPQAARRHAAARGRHVVRRRGRPKLSVGFPSLTPCSTNPSTHCGSGMPPGGYCAPATPP